MLQKRENNLQELLVVCVAASVKAGNGHNQVLKAFTEVSSYHLHQYSIVVHHCRG